MGVKFATDYDNGTNETSSDTFGYAARKKTQLSSKSKQQCAQLSTVQKNNPGISLPKKQHGNSTSPPTSDSELVDNDYKFIERFNRDMMEQFMEHQRQTQVRISN